MASSETSTLDLTTRTRHGSRAVRRLRREGKVPAVIYGGADEPTPVEADARILRNTLAHTGAVLEVCVDGSTTLPVQVKDVQRDAVRGEILHADFYRVDMKVAIQAAVPVEVVGADQSEGVVQGGILTQETTQVHVEALPGDMPEWIAFDASGLAINDTVYVSSLQLPDGVTLVDDPETVLLSLTQPSQEVEETDELETEVAVVGEEAQRQAQGDTEAEAAAATDGDTAE